jgi:hypothetical protein
MKSGPNLPDFEEPFILITTLSEQVFQYVHKELLDDCLVAKIA